jgi:glycosyltransferase involved in cell wall biosynthesis
LVQDEYVAKYENIRLFSQKNQGTSGARNTGIRESRGKYLAFVDPDDYVQENVFGSLLHKMEADNLDILRFAYTMVDEQYCVLPMPGGVIPISSFSDKVDDGKSFLCNELGYSCFCWAYFYKASLIKDNNLYFSPGVYLDDTDWLPLVLCHAKRISSIPIKVNFYLIRAGSLMHGKTEAALRKKIEGSFQMIDILQHRRFDITEEKVKSWYKGMESLLVFSMLKDIFVSLYEERESYLKRLTDKKVFPLKYVGKTVKSKFNFFLINISPILFGYFYRHIKK